MSRDPGDERSYSRRAHRMAALEAMELAEEIREKDEHDPAAVTYWQRDAQVHALLALSAVDS